MAMVSVDGVGFGYDEAGDGPAVVFIHGALVDRRMWEHQFRALSATHRVVRFDWRGYGESDDAAGQFARYEDVLGVMDALGIARATLVGSSMGGAQALEAALATPERVQALVLICSGLSDYEWPPEVASAAADEITRIIPAERFAAYRDGRADHVDPAHVQGIAELNLRLTVVGPGRSPSALAPETWQQAMEMATAMLERQWRRRPPSREVFLEPPAGTRLAQIKAPTLVVKALADEPSLVAVSDRLATEIPGARLLELPDTGHLPPLERPHEISSALTDFLRDLD